MLDNNRKLWWLLIPVFWFSMGLVLPHLNADALWHDEFMAYYRSGGGELPPVTILQTLSRTAEDFSWPPAFYLILAQWQRVSGGSLFIDRLMQTFTGLLTIAVLYQLGKSLFSKRIALFSAILLATSAVFIFYMHELRGHVLYVLSVVLCLWSYRLVLQDRDMQYRWRQGFFVISLVIALYSHYVATAAVVAIGVYHLLFERTTKPQQLSGDKTKISPVEREKNWNRITFLGLLGLGIYGPWLGVLILSLVRRAVYYEPEVTTITSLPIWFYIFFNGILYFAMLPLSLLSLRWIQNRSLRFLWLWTILTIVVSLITNIFTDFLFHPRHLLILLIPICLTLAFVLDKIWQWQPIVTAAVGIVWIIAGVYYSFTPSFMMVIPTQVPMLPLTIVEEVKTIALACFSDDESVILALVEEEHEFIYQIPFFYHIDKDRNGDGYFDDDGYRLSNLNQMQNIRDGELQSLRDISYEERVAIILEGQSGIWLVNNPELSLAADIDHFETALAAEGYTACPTTIDENNLHMTYYTSNNATSCERVVSCGGQ